jgi:hypothetical protein
MSLIVCKYSIQTMTGCSGLITVRGMLNQCKHALSAQQMSKSYGGAQPHMRDTTIMTEERFVGPHLHSLRVAGTQSLVFQVDDVGPWLVFVRKSTDTMTDWQAKPKLLKGPSRCFWRLWKIREWRSNSNEGIKKSFKILRGTTLSKLLI